MGKEGQQEIVEALNAANAVQPCPRGRNLEFEIVGEARIQLVDKVSPLLGAFFESCYSYNNVESWLPLREEYVRRALWPADCMSL